MAGYFISNIWAVLVSNIGDVLVLVFVWYSMDVPQGCRWDVGLVRSTSGGACRMSSCYVFNLLFVLRDVSGDSCQFHDLVVVMSVVGRDA